MKDKFWIYDISELFKDFTILPNFEMSLSHRLNCISRIIIIISIILLVFKYIYWYYILIFGLLLTTILYFYNEYNKMRRLYKYNNYSQIDYLHCKHSNKNNLIINKKTDKNNINTQRNINFKNIKF